MDRDQPQDVETVKFEHERVGRDGAAAILGVKVLGKTKEQLEFGRTTGSESRRIPDAIEEHRKNKFEVLHADKAVLTAVVLEDDDSDGTGNVQSEQLKWKA